MRHNRARTLVSVGAAGMAAALALAGCSTGQSAGSSDATGSASASAGSGGTHTSGPITIAYLQKQGDQQYFVDEVNGARAEAKKLGNVKIVTADLGTDSNKAISSMNTEIGQHVDGVAIVVPDQKIGPQIVQAAGNTPLVASDDPISSGSGAAVPFVGFDSVAMGKQVGNEAGTLYKKAGWTPANTRIIAAYQEGLSDCQQREQGEEAGFVATAGAKVPIIKVGTDNSVVDAQNKTGAVLTSHHAIKHWVVWGCNDENETGAVTALQNANVAPSNIRGVGLGAYLTCKDWKAKKNTGNRAALFIDGHAVGAAAVKVLVEHIRDGKPLPAKTIAKTAMVDATTYVKAGVQCT